MARATTHPADVDRGRSQAVRRGFTLVEMMVVVVVIMVLASLTLSGLAVARQRARLATTKTTLRKLHEIVVPHYESYLRRRVPGVVTTSTTPVTNAHDTFMVVVNEATSPPTFHGPRHPNGTWPAGVTGSTTARILSRSRLQMLRTIQIFEMPDSWGDVATSTALVLSGSFCPSYARTGPVRSYAAFRQGLTTTGSTVGIANGSAECLYLFVARGGLEPDVMEQFRPDEIGDIDRDGAPEFLDGWRRPIQFIRWAPGVSITGSGTPFIAGFPRPSPIQVADANRFHDPLDPARVDAAGFALTPLIYSEGGDMVAGSLVITGTAGWSANLVGTNTLLSIITGNNCGQVGVAASGTAAVRDNIFNHDLNVK